MNKPKMSKFEQKHAQNAFYIKLKQQMFHEISKNNAQNRNLQKTTNWKVKQAQKHVTPTSLQNNPMFKKTSSSSSENRQVGNTDTEPAPATRNEHWTGLGLDCMWMMTNFVEFGSHPNCKLFHKFRIRTEKKRCILIIFWTSILNFLDFFTVFGLGLSFKNSELDRKMWQSAHLCQKLPETSILRDYWNVTMPQYKLLGYVALERKSFEELQEN